MITEQVGIEDYCRNSTLSTVCLGLIIIVLVLWKLKGEWIEAHGEKVDVPGAINYGIALAILIVGFSLVPAAAGILLLVGGIAGLLFFVRLEMKADSPALDISLFRNNPTFTWSSVAALINYSATAATGFLLSLYLQYNKGFTPQHAGLILIAQPVVMALLSPFAGRLSDRLEPRIVSSLGMTLTTVGLISLVFLGEDTSIAAIVFSLIVLGLGFGLFSSPNTNAIMSSVNKKFYGVASGIVSTMRLLGQMFSLATATLLFSIYIGSAQITPDNYGQFLNSAHTAFIIFAVLCFGGIFASLARGKIR